MSSAQTTSAFASTVCGAGGDRRSLPSSLRPSSRRGRGTRRVDRGQVGRLVADGPIGAVWTAGKREANAAFGNFVGSRRDELCEEDERRGHVDVAGVEKE